MACRLDKVPTIKSQSGVFTSTDLYLLFSLNEQ